MLDLKRLYDTRFTSFERIRKNRLWKILCQDFLQHYVYESDVVLDIGAGHCEFINNIRGGRKIALDVNRDLAKIAAGDVEIKLAPVKNLKKLFPADSLNVIFMSNFLEHLDSKEDVFRLLHEAYQILKKGGRILIMQPDINLIGGEYWDFFDHKVPLTFLSVSEALHSLGFHIKDHRYPFLPYTTKAKYLPLWPPLLTIYLKLRPLQKIFGKQFFLCAEK